MDEYYILHWRFDLDIREHTANFDSFTEAEAAMKNKMKFYNDLAYIMITWGSSTLLKITFK